MADTAGEKIVKRTERTERRRNVDRSAATRSQILDATIRALYQFGYGAVTNHLVAELAGVSRGAMMHHFPTRQALMVGAMDFIFAKLTAHRVAELEKCEPGLPRFRRIVDLAFQIASSPAGVAHNEIRAGSRSDPGIAAAVTPIITQISDDYGRFVGRHMREAGLTVDAELRGLSGVIAMTAQAMTINRATYPSQPMFANVVLCLKVARENIIARQLGPGKAMTLEQIKAEKVIPWALEKNTAAG
jgi:AcrR family transcriptional regulator